MRSIRLPGKLAHTLSVVLTFLLTLTLLLTCLTWQMHRVAANSALHESIATDSRILALQMVRIQARVEELAREHHFHKETAMQFITIDALADYNREVTAWWMGLLGEEPEMEAPEWDVSEIEAAVREDALFQENTPANMRRSTARDLVAYEIGLAARKAVLPVRSDILGIIMPKVLEKVDVPTLMNYLALAPQLCGGASIALALLLLLVMLRRVSKAALYIGAGMGAAALCIAGVGCVVYLLDIPGMIAEISTLLAAQVSLLTKQVALQAGLFAAVCLVVGLALIGLHQLDMRRLCRRRKVVA